MYIDRKIQMNPKNHKYSLNLNLSKNLFNKFFKFTSQPDGFTNRKTFLFLTNPRYNATFGVIFNSHGPKFPHIIWAISYGSYDLSVGRFQVAFQFTCNILSLKSFICLIVDSGCIFVLHKYNKRRSHCRFNSPVLNVE